MRINIRGDDITPEKIAEALHRCGKDHGDLSMAGLTIYVSYRDSWGRTVEPLVDGAEITRDFVFRKPQIPQPSPEKQKKTPVPTNPITARDMMQLSSQAAHRALSSPEMQVLITLEKTAMPDREIFMQALSASMKKAGRFSIRDLEMMVIQRCSGA